MGSHATFTNAVAGASNAVAPTRLERGALLRSLLLGRLLERGLSRPRAGPVAARHDDAVLTAIAAVSGLERADRLIAPHDLLSAHLGRGADPTAVAQARLGRRRAEAGWLRAALAPQAPPAVAAGVAFALGRAGAPGAGVAVIDRRWAETEHCEGAIALAQELRLPIAVLAIDSGEEAPADEPGIDWHDLEAVRTAGVAAVRAARAESGPALVLFACTRSEAPGPPRRRFQPAAMDPLAAYEQRLLLHGFTRPELVAIHGEAAAEAERALGGRPGGLEAPA